MTTQEMKTIDTLQSYGLGHRRIAGIILLPLDTVKSYFIRHPVEVTLEVEADSYCRHCGKPLKHIPGKKKKFFCSDRCRFDWWNSHPEHGHRKAYYPAVCASCGASFTTYGNDHRKYCCRACYVRGCRKEQDNG